MPEPARRVGVLFGLGLNCSSANSTCTWKPARQTDKRYPVTIIICMSSRIATLVKSGRGRRLLVWLPPLAWAGLIFFVSAQPKETFQRLGFAGEALSVAGHLIVYFVLMILLVLALRANTNLSNKQVYLAAFLIVAVYSLSDEYHQSFVPGRTPTLVDWIVDLIGAALALLVLLRWEHRRTNT